MTIPGPVPGIPTKTGFRFSKFHNVSYYSGTQTVCQPEIRGFFNLHTPFSYFLAILLLLSHFLVRHSIFAVGLSLPQLA